MKKILAMLLALMLALSCTLALAETAGSSGFPGLTVQSDYDVDREVLGNVLAGFGVDESLIGIADSVAAVIDQAGSRLVISDQGAQAELLLKDTSLVNLVALLGEDGITIGSNLIPSYAVRISSADLLRLLADFVEQQEALKGLDTDALQQALMTHFGSFIDTCTTAVAPGQPEQGEFEIDGVTYNTKVPLNVDLAAIAGATNTLVNDLSNDETVKAALEQLKGVGVNVDTAAPEAVDPATLPAFAADLYMNLDESGNESGPTLVSFTVTPAGETDPATVGSVLVNGASVDVDVQLVSANTEVAFSFDQDANDPLGISCRLDAYVNEIYVGLAAVTGSMDNGIQYDGYLFVQDGDNALASEHGALTLNGELTLGVADGATVLGLDDLTGESDALNGVAMDVFGGAMGIFSTASQLMPDEIGAIASLAQSLMGGSAD